MADHKEDKNRTEQIFKIGPLELWGRKREEPLIEKPEIPNEVKIELLKYMWDAWLSSLVIFGPIILIATLMGYDIPRLYQAGIAFVICVTGGLWIKPGTRWFPIHKYFEKKEE